MTGDDAVRTWLAEQWAVPALEKTVDVEGTPIVYRGWNLGAIDHPGLNLIYGFRAHARWWNRIAPSLSPTHRVVAINLSGMGESGSGPAYSCAQHGREVMAVAADCGFDPVTLVAHSYGAIGAILASIAEPDRVRRLLIIDSALPTAANADHQISVPPMRLYPSHAAAIERFRLIPPGGWPMPEVLAYIAGNSVVQADDGWTWKFDQDAATSLNNDPYRESLFGVAIPTAVIYETETEIMNAERRAIAQSRSAQPT